MPLARDLMNPSPTQEKRRHKLKRLVQMPNSCFMDVKCPSCSAIRTIFSHTQERKVKCERCLRILGWATGGKVKLVNDCSYRKKRR